MIIFLKAELNDLKKSLRELEVIENEDLEKIDRSYNLLRDIEVVNNNLDYNSTKYGSRTNEALRFSIDSERSRN